VSSKLDRAKAKRARRAARGPGFSNYAKGLPRASDLRAQRSNERAAARKKAREEYEKSKTPEELKAEREERRRWHEHCAQLRKKARARPPSK
jgi:hypothetical protein